MLKILKNLKESLISVIIIVILLCLQAGTDLALPDYTSKIVNIGIQQSGIKEVSPKVIRKSKMDEILLLTNDDNEILENYELISKDNLSNKDYEKYLKEFPKLETEELYIKKNLKNDKEEALENKMKKPLMTVASLESKETEEKLKNQMLQNMQEEQKQALSNISLIDIIKTMKEEQRNAILEEINKKIDEMPDTILNSAAISEIKAEYEEIGIDTNKLQNNYILLSGLQMLGVALISMASAVIIMLLSSRVAANLGKVLREKLFKKVLTYSSSEMRKFGVASLITRNTNDIQQIQNLITMLFRVVVYAPIIGIGGFFKVLANKANSMAWIIGLAIVVIILVVMTLFIIAMPKFKKLQELIDKLNGVAREILTGLPVIRAFNKEKTEEERFDKANFDLMKANIFVNRAMSIMMPALMFIMNGITVLIIWAGGHGVEEGAIQVGDMMAFIQYTMQIVMAFLMISMISIMLPRAAVSAKRINEVLETESSIKNAKETKKLNRNKKGYVEFKNVSFRYPDADTEILNDITFTAEPGKTTAIIGSTGSGKSTIVNLIPRFYDVTGGELLIDGVNIKDIDIKTLRDIIGFVPQKGVLFSGTIESNIKYSDKNMSDERMIEAARIAQAEEFINTKKEKYNSEIAQGGNNVSGGQKQRLSIARAIAKNPEIFVFDDSFSALDFKTDVKLRTALSEKTKDKTVIIVAQRISTILNADQIIVLDDGNIVGIGTHEELMKNNETYKEIALSQLSKEELE